MKLLRLKKTRLARVTRSVSGRPLYHGGRGEPPVRPFCKALNPGLGAGKLGLEAGAEAASIMGGDSQLGKWTASI